MPNQRTNKKLDKNGKSDGFSDNEQMSLEEEASPESQVSTVEGNIIDDVSSMQREHETDIISTPSGLRENINPQTQNNSTNKLSRMFEEFAKTAYADSPVCEEKVSGFTRGDPEVFLIKNPQCSYQTQDKISTSIVEEKYVNQGQQLIEEQSGKSSATTKFSLRIDIDEFRKSFPSDENIEEQIQFDYFDRAVLNAVITLYVSNNKGMPYQSIYRAMIGSTDSHVHTSKEQLERIKASLRKMNSTWIEIDFSGDQMILKNKSDGAKQEARILELRYITMRISGRETQGIYLNESPLLLDYAKSRNQLIGFDTQVLALPLNNTKEAIMLREYLNTRIESMKGSPKVSRTILFETALKILPDYKKENSSSARTYESSMRKVIFAILDHWKAINYIKSYTVEGQGKKKYQKLILDV